MYDPEVLMIMLGNRQDDLALSRHALALARARGVSTKVYEASVHLDEAIVRHTEHLLRVALDRSAAPH